MDSLQFAHLVAHLTAEKLSGFGLTSFSPLVTFLIRKQSSTTSIKRTGGESTVTFCKPIPISLPCIHSGSEGLMEGCLNQYLISEM